MESNIPTDVFPHFNNLISGHWAPILLNPIGGSYERLLVGIAVVAKHSFHVKMVGSLSRLKCLYGRRADGVIFSVNLAKDLLLQDLVDRGVEALISPKEFLSGVKVGEVRQAEGLSLEAIADGWLSALSSLHSPVPSEDQSSIDFNEVGSGRTVPRRHQLPQLVYDGIMTRQPEITRYFSERILRGLRTRTTASPMVEIDFKGPRLVANLATLNVTRVMNEIGKIKQSLFDLSVDRTRESVSGVVRAHELIVEVPALEKAELTGSQKMRLREVCSEIEGQADELSLRFRQFGSPEQIIDHIVRSEAA